MYNFLCENCSAQFAVGKFDINNFKCPYCQGHNALGKKATALPNQLYQIHNIFHDPRFFSGAKESDQKEDIAPKKLRYRRKKRQKNIFTDQSSEARDN